MFSYLIKKLKYLFIKKDKKVDDEDQRPAPFVRAIDENVKAMQSILGNSSDVIIRRLKIGPDHDIKAALIFIDGLVNIQIINRNVIDDLINDSQNGNPNDQRKIKSIEEIRDSMISVGDVKDTNKINEAVEQCLDGDTVLIVDGFERVLLISSKGWDKRSIEEPQTQVVIRGPREGFNENLRTNTSLLRRKIKNPDLTFESLTLGRKTRTSICIAYIKGLANDELINKVRRRISGIDIDSVLESGYIEQYIDDAPFSIFDTIGHSEKPDIVAAKMLEGRVAILVDGTPFVLTIPFLYIENFQTAEDYYSRPYYYSMLRFLRYITFFISVTAPAIYVALSTFHQELIPNTLLFSMAAAREGVPFPAVLEAGLTLLAFEILREAGIRLPQQVGQAISIVGALVIGESAVDAGFISAPMVIVLGITAVSSFVVPALNASAGIIRFILLILAGTMGGYGLTIGLLGLLVHLSSMESFGVPFLSPLAPINSEGLKDAMVRAPLWTMLKRPKGMARKDHIRRKDISVPPGLADNNDELE